MTEQNPRFSKKTLDFIVRASRQKRADWLDKNRDDYEHHVLLPLQHLARTIKTALAPQAIGYHFPIKGIGRLKRTAASRNKGKSQYKDWLSWSASRPTQSRFDHNPSLFFLIQPFDQEGDEFLIAGGLYMPSSRQLKAIRQSISVDATAFERLFKSPSFSSRFPGGFSDEKKSSRPPRGFDPNHPRIEWLKLQGYFVWRSYRPRQYSSAEFSGTVAKDFEQILKLNQLLEQAIEGRSRPLEQPQQEELLGRIDTLNRPQRPMDF